MPDARTFSHFAEEFDLLATALDDSSDPEQRKILLTRMKVVIDQIDDLILQDASLYRVPMSRGHANGG